MIKKEFQKPMMEAIELQPESQILAGSVTSVTTTGLNDDNLALPGEEESKSGSIWDNAY